MEEQPNYQPYYNVSEEDDDDYLIKLRLLRYEEAPNCIERMKQAAHAVGCESYYSFL